eukprot:CAMPEP_0197577314 /NCGR_PEP_ID=MMETSP1326-20131121/1995_1 /TAXON_ID=1155430 /ORGANISM="Genus nov. species nov., Strain RCC2288" /LENGTH=244 /DNA_ID=CAMNT_0043140369 /DNA_START=490 /DNA_END=1220 /DNA_ORIENTATION=+
MDASSSSSSRSGEVIGLLLFTSITVVIFIALVVCEFSIALLKGLTYYILPETEEEKYRARLAKVSAASSTHASAAARRRGGGAGRAGARAGNLDEFGEESIAAIRVQKSMLVLRPFWAHFDHLVVFAAIVSINFAAAEAAPLVLPGAGVDNALLPLLCMIGAVSAVRALVKVELDRLTPPVERYLALGVGVLGFVVSLFFLLLVPTSVMDFEMDRTSREMGPAIMNKIKKRFGGVAAAVAAAGA